MLDIALIEKRFQKEMQYVDRASDCGSIPYVLVFEKNIACTVRIIIAANLILRRFCLEGKMTLILVMDNECAIGRDGGLLCRLPEDMKRFRETTQNSVVIMGRKTYESFPKRPLPNRENIVLSRSEKEIDGAEVYGSVESVLERVKNSEKPVFVIGGAEIYRQFAPFCDTALITRVYENFGGDTFFENIEHDKEWELSEVSPVVETNCHRIRFFKFVKK